MCRYAAYIGPPIPLSSLIYKPSNSLVHQATEAMKTPTRINADGFGVGWYVSESREPAVFKDISPVWNNRNLGEIADKIYSRSIAAHVRSAKSFDPVMRENCHPFRRGRLLWMHNGDIPGRARLTRQVGIEASDELLAMIRGNTDTEAALTLFLARLDTPFDEAPLEVLAGAMEETVAQIAEWHRETDGSSPLELNFCLLTGREIVATRFAIARRTGPTLYWCANPLDGDERSVLVASEPLFERGDWHEVPPGTMLVIDADLEVEERRLAA